MKHDVFGRMNDCGNVDILLNDGTPATRLDLLSGGSIYPVGSDLSLNYEHPEGIELTVEDTKKIGFEIE